MALGEFTKQLAQQAILSATKEPPKDQPAPSQPERTGAVILAQINAMQKALKDDEELSVVFYSGPEKIRVHEIFMPTWQVAVLSGVDQDRVFARAVVPAESLNLIVRIMKTQAGAKPGRLALKAPRQ